MTRGPEFHLSSALATGNPGGHGFSFLLPVTSARLLVAGDTWLLALCWGWALNTGILSLLFTPENLPVRDVMSVPEGTVVRRSLGDTVLPYDGCFHTLCHVYVGALCLA